MELWKYARYLIYDHFTYPMMLNMDWDISLSEFCLVLPDTPDFLRIKWVYALTLCMVHFIEDY